MRLQTPSQPANPMQGDLPPRPSAHRPPSTDGFDPGPPGSSGKRWLILLIAAAVLAAAYWLTPLGKIVRGGGATTQATGGPPGGRIVPVIAVTARKGDLPIYLTGLGTASPLNTVTVRTRVDGQIEDIGFREGQIVTEGQMLVQIDKRPFEVQLLQAQGQLAKDQAALANAQVELERDKQAADAISKQQLDTQAALVDQYKGTVKTDEAAVKNADLQITYSRITAPITGRIGLKLVDKGNIIHASDANGVAVLTQLQPISVMFTLAQDNIPQVLKAMKRATTRATTLPVEAYDRDMKNKLATGGLSAINSQVDPDTGTIRLKALFENANDELYPNQFVNARLLVDTRRDATIVPSAAVQRGPDSTFVYLITPNDTAEVRQVVVGPSEADQTVIESGISPGDRVVIEGVDKLQPGAKVMARMPGTRPASGPGARSATNRSPQNPKLEVEASPSRRNP